MTLEQAKRHEVQHWLTTGAAHTLALAERVEAGGNASL
jgi:hypothetical protein